MQFVESLEQAKEYSRQALAVMDEHIIPANPINYTIWYVYQNGMLSELKRDLDILISNDQKFTPARNLEIYDRYFGQNAQEGALQEAGRRIEAAVSQLLKVVDKVGNNSADYGETLVSYTGKLAGSVDAEDVKTVVAGILAETQKMAAEHKKLETQIRESSRQITKLQSNMQAIRQESLTDALTGITNRKGFDDRIKRAVGEAMETGEALSLVMIDIDFFKKFNDTHGHLLGDEVLKLVAKTFTQSVKGQDLAARYGGEEFVVMLPKTKLNDAVILANQIRETVAKKKIVSRASGTSLGSITLSMGVAQHKAGEPIVGFIGRADQALYAAKRDGRNRVVSEKELSSKISIAS